jgi:hypothetical protein
MARCIGFQPANTLAEPYTMGPGSASRLALRTSPATPMIRQGFSSKKLRITIMRPIGSTSGKYRRAVSSLMMATGSLSSVS